ncbi:MAG: Fur-regulated basic protein FbpA [Psychrobacillus psychrotolerans]|uniref:Fur-regulated basic protein A n=1 Tax=Psychrobacillus psychrotolerans TaxID=126156 RepID=A0A1I6AN84_9BACI|nr:Fur-regulated basic protein FbpA [Psychrobacillus psychrotolerans]SFQ70112.1 Fur-regulated basic protein A [Psychrobacillus psychrotolerans]
MMMIKESQTEQKRDGIIEEFVNKGVYKIDGRQLYELNFYELMKEYTTEEESK